ncbi:MAG: hypothetical protein ABIK28_00040 [Planctomycetota bacterium]
MLVEWPIFGTYSIGSDINKIIGKDSGTQTQWFGGVGINGDHALASTVTVGNPAIGVLIRRSAGHSNASLTGEYYLLIILNEINDPDFSCFSGIVKTNGDGFISGNGIFNREGSLIGTEFIATYTIYDDGELLMFPLGSSVNWFQGAVNNNGTLATVASHSPHVGPSLMVFIKI